MSKLVENFNVYLNQTVDSYWEAKFQWIKAVLQLILYISIKGGDIKRVHWWLTKEAEESKVGKSLRLDKK